MTKKNISLVSIIVIVAIACFAFAKFMPNTAKTVKNKVTEIDKMVGDANVIENYKAEYSKLTSKKIDVEKAIQDFAVQINVSKNKLETERAVRTKMFEKLEEFSASNDAKSFNIAKNNFECQDAKVKMLETTIANYETGKEKLENSLSTIKIALSKYKTNIDIIEGRKVMADNFKQVNGILENLSGTGDDDMALQLEKIDETLLVETVKMEVLHETNVYENFGNVLTQEEMSEYINSHR